MVRKLVVETLGTFFLVMTVGMAVLGGGGGGPLAVGAIVLLLIIRDHRILSRYAYTLGLVGIVLVLIPALLPARYSVVNGAKLWILIGGFSIQPGEFAKLALLSFFAFYLVRKRIAMSQESEVAGVFDALQGHAGQHASPGLPCLWGHDHVVGRGLDQEGDLPQAIDE